MANHAERIVAGLGGIDNILEIKGYSTRLNAEVKDASLLEERALVEGGAQLVGKWRTSIRIVIDDADPIAAEIEAMLPG
jgi:PTS system N-acetylglucosamine-specific IIB component